jgi:hypothetical protein
MQLVGKYGVRSQLMWIMQLIQVYSNFVNSFISFISYNQIRRLNFNINYKGQLSERVQLAFADRQGGGKPTINAYINQ